MKTVLTLVIAGLLLVGVAGYKLTNHTKTTKSLISNVENTTTDVDSTFYVSNSSAPVPAEPLAPKKKVENLVLEEDNTVLLTGEIGANAFGVAQEITQKALKNKVVYLVISSPGGSVLDGAAIVSAVQASKTPVVTICQSLCASMAAIIFEAGSKRLMVDRSILMFHDAAGGVQGTFPQIKDRFEFFSSYVNKMDNEIAHRAGLTLPEFMSKLNPECWRDAEDSLKEHFSDGYANLVFVTPPQDQGPGMSQTKNLKSKFEVQLGN